MHAPGELPVSVGGSLGTDCVQHHSLLDPLLLLARARQGRLGRRYLCPSRVCAAWLRILTASV